MTPKQEKRLADIEEWYLPLMEVRSARSVELVHLDWLCQLVREQAEQLADTQAGLDAAVKRIAELEAQTSTVRLRDFE